MSSTVPINNGQYRATITSTPEVGLFTAIATDTWASSPTGAVRPDSGLDAAGVKILKKPKRETESKKVKCNSPKKYKVKVGKHTFKVRATDQAGNTGQPAKYKFERVKKK